MFGALKRARHVSQSVRQIVKKILFGIRTCHPSRESSNQEACGEWAPHPGCLPIATYTPIATCLFCGDSFYYPSVSLLLPPDRWQMRDRDAIPRLIYKGWSRLVPPSAPRRWILNGRLETRTVAPQADKMALLVAGVAQWVRFAWNRWQESLFVVQGETVTSHVRIECCSIWVDYEEECGAVCLWLSRAEEVL